MSLLLTIREILAKSFGAMPHILLGISLFLGITQGNIGLLMLSAGLIFVVPSIVILFNTLFEFIASYSEGFKSMISVPVSDTCFLIPSLAPPSEGFMVNAPSYWMAHAVFFFSYLITNAITLYRLPVEEGADADKVENRKSQALTALVVSLGIFVAFVLLRFFAMGCETALGLIFAILLVAPAGFGWERLAEYCGARTADIFGIVQGILPVAAQDTTPTTCVYNPPATAPSS